MPASFKIFRPSSLAEIVEAIWDLDVPDGDAAKALTIEHAPGTSLFLIAQYRMPFRTDWQSLSNQTHNVYPLFATQVQTGIASIYPTGPLGVTVICLKPEAVARLLGVPLGDFADTKIDLRDLFNVEEVSLLEEMLAEASNSRERIVIVEAFMLRIMRRIRPDSVTCHAAMVLRRDPNLSVRQLAAQLDISERHLLRGFQATFGMGPKKFMRLARIERVLETRCHGGAWPDIAYARGFADIAIACGFADQAHMIREFKAVLGRSPVSFFRPASSGDVRHFTASVRITNAISLQ